MSRDGLIKSGSVLVGFKRVSSNSDRTPVQVVFMVPKRMIRKAHVRNLVKRRVREAYRLNKHLIGEDGRGRTLLISILYRSSKVADYASIEKDIKQALVQLSTTNDSLS